MKYTDLATKMVTPVDVHQYCTMWSLTQYSVNRPAKIPDDRELNQSLDYNNPAYNSDDRNKLQSHKSVEISWLN